MSWPTATRQVPTQILALRYFATAMWHIAPSPRLQAQTSALTKDWAGLTGAGLLRNLSHHSLLSLPVHCFCCKTPWQQQSSHSLTSWVKFYQGVWFFCVGKRREWMLSKYVNGKKKGKHLPWYSVSNYKSMFSQAIHTAVDLSGFCSTPHCLLLTDSFGSRVKTLVCKLVRTSVQSQ